MDALKEPRKKNGALRDLVLSVPVGGSITVHDHLEANRIQSGSRNWGIKFSRAGVKLTRVQ